MPITKKVNYNTPKILMNMWGFKKNKSERDQFARTPKALYDQLNEEFLFDFDPCPVNPTFDGLLIDWKVRNYVNPPYDSIAKWLDKALTESKSGRTSVFLIPFKPSTKYWHKYIIGNPQVEIRAIEGKVTFEPYTKPAPFDCAIVIIRPEQPTNHEQNRETGNGSNSSKKENTIM